MSASDKKFENDTIHGDDTASPATESTDDELAELGKVSETKGGWFGFSPDTGGGWKTGG